MITDRWGNEVRIIKETKPDKVGRIVIKQHENGRKNHDYLHMLNETEPGEIKEALREALK